MKKHWVAAILLAAIVLCGCTNPQQPNPPADNIDNGDKNEGGNQEEIAVCIYMIHNNLGAPCLRELEFLEGLKEKYTGLEVREIITNTADGYNRANKLAESYGWQIASVPVTFIGEGVIGGFSDSKAGEIENRIINCVKNGNCECREI